VNVEYFSYCLNKVAHLSLFFLFINVCFFVDSVWNLRTLWSGLFVVPGCSSNGSGNSAFGEPVRGFKIILGLPFVLKLYAVKTKTYK